MSLRLLNHGRRKTARAISKFWIFVDAGRKFTIELPLWHPTNVSSSQWELAVLFRFHGCAACREAAGAPPCAPGVLPLRVSRFGLSRVLSTMAFTKGWTMNTTNRIALVFVASTLGLAGCDTESDVLTSTQQALLQTGEGSWVEWCPKTDSTSDMAAFMAQATQGLACTQQDEDEVCGLNLDSQGCGWNTRNCVAGHVQAATTVTLGCPASRTETPVNRMSCSDALASGNSGDVCSWQGACSRTTADACCIEVAACVSQGVSTNVVQRNRICAPGCTNVVAQPEPIITSCADASTAIGQYAASCSAGLVCVQTGPNEMTSISDMTNTGQLAMAPLYFCVDGKFMFAPSPLATLIF